MDRLPNNSQIIEPRFRRVEVLTGPERRRRWSNDEKAGIVAESQQSGVVAATVARRYGVHPNQLYGWRRELREKAAATEMEFVPVAVIPETTATPIEVCANGMVVRVVPGVDLSLLADVLRIVKGER